MTCEILLDKRKKDLFARCNARPYVEFTSCIKAGHVVRQYYSIGNIIVQSSDHLAMCSKYIFLYSDVYSKEALDIIVSAIDKLDYIESNIRNNVHNDLSRKSDTYTEIFQFSSVIKDVMKHIKHDADKLNTTLNDYLKNLISCYHSENSYNHTSAYHMIDLLSFKINTED